MNMNTLVIALLCVIVAQQALDIWTTYQVIRLGGTERNAIVLAVIARIGVLPALLLLKAVLLGALAWVSWSNWPSSPQLIGLLAVIAAVYVWVLVNNFQALKQQKAVAAAHTA